VAFIRHEAFCPLPQGFIGGNDMQAADLSKALSPVRRAWRAFCSSRAVKLRDVREPLSPPALVPARRGFVKTRWSLVFAASWDDAPRARQAFAELCKLYWYPLYEFIRRQGLSPDDAKELIQDFFVSLLEKKGLAIVDPDRGRFRSWLLAAVRNYLRNYRAHQRAKIRGGNWFQLDLEDAERCFSQALAPELTPEQAFDRRWAEKLLENVLRALGEQEKRRGRGPLFDKLKGTILGENEGLYPRLAKELGMKEGAVRVAACRLKKSYRLMLRQQIARTVKSREDVDDELRFLCSVFGDV
jgi:RNA polymerase sigma factor (sigma-70 family)